MTSPLWLTHHVPDQHDRCARVGSQLVCRRCLASNPVALTFMVLSLAGIHWPANLDPALLWLMPLAAIIDFVAEHFKLVTYNARRQAVLSALGGVAFGRGLGRYLNQPSDHLFWTVSITYSLVMVSAVYLSSRREKQRATNLRLQESDTWWADMQASLDKPRTTAADPDRDPTLTP